MYKVKPVTLPFERPVGFGCTMYHMKNTNEEQEVKDDVQTIIKKQKELILRIEHFFHKMLAITRAKSLPDEIFDMADKGSSTPMDVRRYDGRYELVCCCSAMIPFSVIALPDWIPGGVLSNVHILLYSHSSLLMSCLSSSRRFESALKALKQKVPLCYRSEASPLSLVIRIIVTEGAETKDVGTNSTFYLHDFENGQISKCLYGESVLIRCLIRLLGLTLNNEDIDEILAFSQAANSFLTSNLLDESLKHLPCIAKNYSSSTALALQSLPFSKE